MFPCSAIILAGGHSTRMGRDKASLPVPQHEQQRTFVEQLVALLTSLCSEVILVVRDSDQQASFRHLAAASLRIVTDSVPNVGPLMGVQSGLRAMTTTHALVVAVDMPFLQAAMVSFLLSQPLDDALLVPRVNAVPQVLCAVYPRTVLPLIEARLREGRRDPRSLLTVASVRYIEEEQLRQIEPHLHSFININTPDELRNIRET